uniref:(northern house mosquito) hypothetical protein n=1 Tax=Culex pipiens TaxID=7175 RepID=A0A8D8B5Q2_CULPI
MYRPTSASGFIVVDIYTCTNPNDRHFGRRFHVSDESTCRLRVAATNDDSTCEGRFNSTFTASTCTATQQTSSRTVRGLVVVLRHRVHTCIYLVGRRRSPLEFGKNNYTH